MIRNRRSRLSVALTMALAVSMAFAPAALAKIKMSTGVSKASKRTASATAPASGPQIHVVGGKAVTKTFTPNKTKLLTFFAADEKGVVSAELTKDGEKIDVGLRNGRDDKTARISAIFAEEGDYTLTVKGGSGTTVKTISISK